MTLPTSIPVRREPEGEDVASRMDLIGFGLMALLVLLLVVTWLKRRSVSPGGLHPPKSMAGWAKIFVRSQAPAITVLSSTRLTPQHSLHEVSWQGRRMLIACVDRSASVLGDVPMAAPVPSETLNGYIEKGASDEER